MIHLFEDDARAKTDPTFPVNCGSFSKIHLNLNKELKKLGFYSEEGIAEWHGFSTGLGLDFGNTKWNRFAISVWETSVLPDRFINFRAFYCREGDFKYRFFGLSKQVSDLWKSYGFTNTPIINIGVDADFWNPNLDKGVGLPPVLENAFKTDKFKILSVTALNFRSGINSLLEAFGKLDKNKYRLIIKNTEDRAYKIPHIIEDMRGNGYDIHYCCERLNDHQIKRCYNLSNLLCYNVLNTSGSLPLLEAAACGLPSLAGDFCPTNIYPSTDVVRVMSSTIAECKQELTEMWGLPYTFPEGFIDESKALLYKLDIDDFCDKIENVCKDYPFYKSEAINEIPEVKYLWSWEKSARDLIRELGYSL